MPFQIGAVSVIVKIKVILKEILPITVHGMGRTGKRPKVSIFKSDFL